jgi:hypothetical protein
LYLASHVQSAQQFHRVLDKKVTVLFLLIASNEDYKASTASLLALAHGSNLIIDSRTLTDPENAAFLDQMKEVVDAIEALIIAGHRVCLDISSKILRFFPIHMLYLILFMRSSYGEALEIMGHN